MQLTSYSSTVSFLHHLFDNIFYILTFQKDFILYVMASEFYGSEFVLHLLSDNRTFASKQQFVEGVLKFLIH
jgi:hypothetical protein